VMLEWCYLLNIPSLSLSLQHHSLQHHSLQPTPHHTQIRAALDLLFAMTHTRPHENDRMFLVVPWDRWDTRLAVGSIAKMVVDLTGNKHIRVRESAFRTALALASSDVGRETVTRHLLCKVEDDMNRIHSLAYRARILRSTIQRDVELDAVTQFCSDCLNFKSKFLRIEVISLLNTLERVYPKHVLEKHLKSEAGVRWISKHRKSLPKEISKFVYGDCDDDEDEDVVLVSPRRGKSRGNRSRSSSSSSSGGLVSKFRMMRGMMHK